MTRLRFLVILLIPLLCFSCKKFRRPGLPFGDFKGTHFTEVQRIYTNGLKFDKQGYQLEPSWRLFFVSDDSVNVYSPKTKRYYGFHVYFDHDSTFNMVDAWFKLRKLAPDSMILQALRVENKIIKDHDEGSKVLLTFYSDRYIKSHDSRKIMAMGLPCKKDSAFVKLRSKQVNTQPDSTFSAREPVVLKSKTPLVKVEKVKNESTPINEADAADDYLAPEYNITIHKTYEGFNYIMYVYVDERGKMTFRNSVVPLMPEFKASYEQVMRGIVDGYLMHYLDITPGKTLGISHSTCILLNVAGKLE
ncbi:hypothetical protein [Mucilaginibacter sp. BT774]|uniref:hypothetical protein n=1 Tax=Mucilaginibacter sp. BT774 TaxID=3062276 RepID=UPI0026748D6C|nr:hypothetical protein [Mucilaginibacter sp. BT774]MDO3625772.1 hypothetical protein [Mucilaginibacter sp. BT774]